MRADLLTDAVEGLDEALAAVDGFDGVLVGGLLRPQRRRRSDWPGLRTPSPGRRWPGG